MQKAVIKLKVGMAYWEKNALHITSFLLCSFVVLMSRVLHLLLSAPSHIGSGSNKGKEKTLNEVCLSRLLAGSVTLFLVATRALGV